MRRRFKTRRRNKQRKIIIISVCCLLLIMTVGYAAMQTNLSINAKGNILQNTIDITDNIVDSGDGLYIDTYETEGTRYVYKGANPNNFIEFNNELWRIISKEADGTYKIIRNDVLEDRYWDSSFSCPIAYNGIKRHNNTTVINNIIYLAPDPGLPTGCNIWTRPSTLNTYLNEEYYNTFSEITKNQITQGIFNIGGIIDTSNDLTVQIEEESEVQWSGKIGLISASEYVRANSNMIECGTISLNNSNSICLTTNWMYLNDNWWTISTETSTSIPYVSYIDNGSVFRVLPYSGSYYTDVAPRPVVYLSSDIKIVSGAGTETDAYQIEL